MHIQTTKQIIELTSRDAPLGIFKRLKCCSIHFPRLIHGDNIVSVPCAPSYLLKKSALFGFAPRGPLQQHDECTFSLNDKAIVSGPSLFCLEIALYRRRWIIQGLERGCPFPGFTARTAALLGQETAASSRDAQLALLASASRRSCLVLPPPPPSETVVLRRAQPLRGGERTRIDRAPICAQRVRRCSCSRSTGHGVDLSLKRAQDGKPRHRGGLLTAVRVIS